jgi:hypothetical protein
MMQDRASTLNFCGLWSHNERASGMFVPTGKDIDPEASICLCCTLPGSKCRGSEKCARYRTEMKVIKGKEL